MAEIIRMPRMSDTMTEGVIVEWHKKVGDTIKSGDLMAEVETDKATMELESYNNGTLLYIGVDKGGKVAVDGVLAVIGKPGEDFQSLLKGESGGSVAPAEIKEAVETNAAPSSVPAIDISNMPEVVLMPRMSDTMAEGVIASWNKKVGDTVKSGELLAEVETDKATMELESYVSGTLLHIGVEQGGKVPVNQLLAIIGDPNKVDVAAIVAASKNTDTTVSSAPAEVQNIASVAQTETVSTSSASSTAVTDANGKIKASPLAKKMAQEKGVNINEIVGSGDGGRIVKRDVDNYKTSAAASVPVAVASSGGIDVFPWKNGIATGVEGHNDTPNSQMRKTIARRLSESKFTAPHFYLKMEVIMDNAMAARTAMNAVSPVKISFQDMMIKACAMALRLHPAVNSSWMGEFIRTYNHIHIGSAVAVEEGLIVPVFKFADQKSLSQIATEANDLYTKAKTKKLQPQEFSGNTFTISNLGMMDIDEFTAIINPPDSAILAVGKIKEVVIRKADGSFGVNNVMTLTLSCDHRIVDGAVGARFLQTLKSFLENPVNMLV